MKCSLKKVSINIFVEVRDRHNWGLFLVPDFLNTKPKRKLLFFFLVKYNAALSVRIRDFAVQCFLSHQYHKWIRKTLASRVDQNVFLVPFRYFEAMSHQMVVNAFVIGHL